MAKLSDTQRVILSQASQHDQRLAPLPKIPAAARNAVLRSMLKQEMLEELPAPREYIGLGWRQDEEGAWIVLRITDAGLRAIGVEPEEPEPEDTRPRDVRNGVDPRLVDGDDEPATAGDTAPTDGEDAAPGGMPAISPEAALYPARAEELILLDEALATSRPAPQATLRAAARRVLDAWDDEENQRYDLADAIDALRAVLAT